MAPVNANQPFIIELLYQLPDIVHVLYYSENIVFYSYSTRFVLYCNTAHVFDKITSNVVFLRIVHNLSGILIISGMSVN